MYVCMYVVLTFSLYAFQEADDSIPHCLLRTDPTNENNHKQDRCCGGLKLQPTTTGRDTQ